MAPVKAPPSGMDTRPIIVINRLTTVADRAPGQGSKEAIPNHASRGTASSCRDVTACVLSETETMSSATRTGDPSPKAMVGGAGTSAASSQRNSGQPSVFVDALDFSVEKKAATQSALERQGVRLLPYPFASAVSVVSDLDSSSRQRYGAYVGMLVDKLGLDFGDSTWLRWCLAGKGNPDDVVGTAFGFFSRFFSIGRGEKPSVFAHTRTFCDSIAEFHAGNVDHFHSLLSRGPRVILLNRFEISDRAIEATLGPFEDSGPSRGADVFVFGICVVAAPGKQIRVRSVRVVEKNGSVFDGYIETPFVAPPNGRQHRLFTRLATVEAEAPLPLVIAVDKIVIHFDDPGDAANVERVLLTNATGDVLLDRLRLLRDRYNIEMGLITEHAGRYFRTLGRARKCDEQMRDQVASQTGPMLALNGRLNDDNGQLIFSTDADDPHSFFRVVPEITSEFEVRFLVPAAATTTEGWATFDLVTPSLTRMGSGFYWARRTMPNIRQPEPGRKFDGTRSHADNFAERLAKVLAGCDQDPGNNWPVYTHLGAISGYLRKQRHLRRGGQTEDDEDDENAAVPSPYFQPATPLFELQDRVFNISGSFGSNQRLWFARATVLYDYALMLRIIAEHVSRPDANTVHICSWHDAVLDKQLPRSPAQLYGLTFYVDDPTMAQVSLDDRTLPILARNPPDATGRPSVTIAESEIRTVVFEQLDPTVNLLGEAKLAGGTWTWSKDADGFTYGRLAAFGQQESSAGLITLTLPLHGLTPIGAQYLAFALRRSEGSQFGLLFETRSGGRFFFGDSAVLEGFGQPVTASYLFTQHSRAAGRWHMLVAPFHDLTWASGAQPGAPMPSHPLETFTLICAAPEERGIDIGNLAFLRPRATALSQRPEQRYCLGGAIPAFKPDQRVHAASLVDESAQLTETVDQRGHFCFAQVPRGIYRVWSPVNGHELHDRRGPLVEVGGNVMHLVLERPWPSQ